MSVCLAAVVTFPVQTKRDTSLRIDRNLMKPIRRLINGQSVYIVAPTVRDRHKQLTNVSVTYGRTIFSRPLLNRLDIGPSVIFLGPWCTTTGSINIVLTQWWIRQEGWRFASGRYARKAGMLNPSTLFHDYIWFHASRNFFLLIIYELHEFFSPYNLLIEHSFYNWTFNRLLLIIYFIWIF